MDWLEEGDFFAYVGTGGYTETADETCTEVGDDIAVEVGENHYIVEVGLLDQLHTHVVYDDVLELY